MDKYIHLIGLAWFIAATCRYGAGMIIVAFLSKEGTNWETYGWDLLDILPMTLYLASIGITFHLM